MIKQCQNCKKNFRRRPNGNNRKYCSVRCRLEATQETRRLCGLEWQRRARKKRCKEDRKNKTKCLICKGYYYGLGGHIFYAHGVRAREYKLKFGLFLSKPLHSDIIHERESAAWRGKKEKVLKNLLKGACYRYRKGQTFEDRIIVHARKEQLTKHIKHYQLIQRKRKERIQKKHEKLEELKSIFGDDIKTLQGALYEM